MSKHLEYEMRFYIDDIDSFRRKLIKVNATKIQEKKIMPLTVYKHPNGKEMYIRIRDEGRVKTLTIKKKGSNKKYEIEREIEINSLEEGDAILKLLGCKKRYHVEKLRETWNLEGCKEIVIDSYPGLKEYIEVDCHNLKSLDAAIKKLDLERPSDDTDLGVTKMYYDQYGIPMNRKADGDLTFKNGKKLFSKYIKKNKSLFNKIIKEQQTYYKK